MRLILLRHGQTASNTSGALDTAAPGAPLSRLGERQASAVPGTIAGHTVEAVFASPLQRAVATAEPLAEALGLELGVLDGLAEVSAGDLEMRADHAAIMEYVAVLMAWGKGDLTAKAPGGENCLEFLERFDSAVERIVASGASTAVATSHGAAIRVWVSARGSNLDADFASNHLLDNTGFAVLHRNDSESSDSGWSLDDWHAEPAGGPELVGEDSGPAAYGVTDLPE